MVLDSGNQVAFVAVRFTRDDQCLEPGYQRQQKLKDGRKIDVLVGVRDVLLVVHPQFQALDGLSVGVEVSRSVFWSGQTQRFVDVRVSAEFEKPLRSLQRSRNFTN